MTDLVPAAEQNAPAIPTDVPAEWQALMRLTARIAGTSMVPRPIRGNGAEVLSVMLHGAELGLAPITALRSIHIIEGQPTASAQLMRALILREGHILQWREVSSEKVVLYGKRRDTGSDALVTWTLDDAKRANLAGKGNWKTYPRAMLAARATSEIARLLFADLLHGLSYTPEETGGGGPYDAIDVTDPTADPMVIHSAGDAEWDDDDPANPLEAAP